MNTITLSAWIGEQQIGTLSYHNDTGRFSFSYEQAWITQIGAYPISPALPFQRPDKQTDELHSVNVRRFFENLLPEGKALEDAMAIGDEFNITKIRAFDWADFTERCGIERRLLVRQMNRMIKVLRTELPKLLSHPVYTADEQKTFQEVSNLMHQQAKQLETDAKMITTITMG
ncbi:MAG: HipA N-terminal domain-containing protein [Ectothiorhodospiraceae bacterium]|nr:HipA N-terminal domain-containing protein [Ectothiorhodospiraceae bacterium]